MAVVRIGVIAGEASGTALGAGLIRALHEQYPDCEIFGVGGEAMAAAGCEIWHDASELSVMGLTEVIRHLPRLLRLRRRLRARFLAAQPDLFIGIDLPDFNLGVARWLRERGVKTMQYVSPSVWAWRERRVKGIARAVDEVLCLLPFEARFYDRHGVAATFVGHPLADDIAAALPAGPARERLGLPADAQVIAVLPGSRGSEVSALAATFAQTVALLAAAVPGRHFVIPIAQQSLAAPIRATFAAHAAAANIHFLDAGARDAMAAADVVLLASGTATLEAMLIGRPMVVAYRLSASTYWLLKNLNLMKVAHYSLPNLLAGRALVAECLQHDAQPTRLAAELTTLLDDDDRRTQMLAAFDELRGVLANDASHSAASAVLARAGAVA